MCKRTRSSHSSARPHRPPSHVPDPSYASTLNTTHAPQRHIPPCDPELILYPTIVPCPSYHAPHDAISPSLCSNLLCLIVFLSPTIAPQLYPIILFLQLLECRVRRTSPLMPVDRPTFQVGVLCPGSVVRPTSKAHLPLARNDANNDIP